eukprot:9251729-Pyramimonas_sp.AAC.1
MISGRLILVDESGELGRRKCQPELKNRSHAASRKELDQKTFLTWTEFPQLLAPGVPGGGNGGVGGLSSPPSSPFFFVICSLSVVSTFLSLSRFCLGSQSQGLNSFVRCSVAAAAAAGTMISRGAKSGR